MIQSKNNINDCSVTLTKNRYSNLFGYLSKNNYEVEINRNNSSFCIYMDKDGLKSLSNQINQFLKDNEDNESNR